MKRGIVLLGLSLLLGTAIAQGQPPATPNSRTSDVPSEASAEHIYGPKDGVKPPKLTYSPDPQYPKEERKARHQGTVVLWVVVGPDGSPRDIGVARVLSPDFDEAAIDAVKKWKFSPGTKDGEPVATKINVEVTFRLY